MRIADQSSYRPTKMARLPTSLVRKQIYLDEALDRLLKQWAANAGVSQSELVRQALSRHAAHVAASARPRNAWRRQRRRIRASIARGPLDGIRNWTREDLYRRET